MKKLSKNDDDRKAAIAAEDKLQRLGFVDWVENLSDEDRKMIFDLI